MELKKLYQSNPLLFSEETDLLREKLLEAGWPKERIDPIIQVLDAGLMNNDLSIVNETVHVGIFNIICFRLRDKTGLPIEKVKEAVMLVLEAADRKIEGSPLDLMNPPTEED